MQLQTASMFTILMDPRAYVAYWVSKKERVSAISIPTLHLDYANECQALALAGMKFRPLSKHLLECAFEEYLQQIPILKRKQIADSLKGASEDLSPISTWVKAVTGKQDTDDVHIMAHWAWLVKRNSLGLPVVHHIMPIITSPKQGGGKSTAIHKLLTPLKGSTLELQVPQVVDERSFTMFSNYLVGFFDEMAGADKVDIADFKRNVTSSTLTYRPMRTNTQEIIQNLCTFIGAGNNQLYEIIKDTTGIRRFFPIKALDLTDWTAINNLDYLKLWQGIDVNRPRGYYELVKDSVVLKQEEAAMKDEVLIFLEEYSVLPTGPTVIVNGRKLYQEYLLHASSSGIRFNVSAQTFYKKLRDMGLKSLKRPDERRILTWFFAVNADSPVNKATGNA